MAENNNLIPTEPDWDGTPLSRAEEIMYSIIHTEAWDGTPLSRGEYLLLQIKDVIENNSMLDLKGRVDTIADLPATGNKKGDTYSVGPADQLNLPEYFWTGTEWQYLGQIVDLSGYLQLSGGTMTGALQFNIANKHLTIDVVSGNTQITSSDSKIFMASTVGVDVVISRGQITLGGTSVKAFTYDYSSNATAIWGADTTIEGAANIVERSGQISQNNYVNTITQSGSNGVSVATKKALTVTSENGLTVTNSGAPTTITSTAQDLTIQANGADALIQAQGGTMDLKATGGKMTLYSAGGQTPGVVMEAWGGPIAEMSTNYVSITSPYASGYVYLQGGTGSSESNINLSGGSISETAYANVSLTATNGVMSLSSGNNSSWTATGNLNLTATNGQARLQGATVSITDSSSTLDMTSSGTTISVPGGKSLTLQTTGTSPAEIPGDVNVVAMDGGIVVAAREDIQIVTDDGATTVTASEYSIEANNTETDDQSNFHNLSAVIETAFVEATQSDPASNKLTIRTRKSVGQTTESEAKIELTSDDGGLITMTTPSFDINGVPVYISTTQPTGNIPIGAIGLGW